jgi:poly-gamma-glutamate synthase PgsB/CapB
MEPRVSKEASVYFIVFLFLILSFLIVEKILHDQRSKRIPIRIHINGTRGKSSVVRLIAQALREAGVPAMAKMTGTTPTLIYPDGHEEVIRRRGPSRIQEQMTFIKQASQLGVQAVIVECMAIEPQLQLLSEVGMIQSTIGVITNVRHDHLELMGRSLDDIAESLSLTIPRNGILVTAEKRYFKFFGFQAKKRNTETFLVEDVGASAREGRKEAPALEENRLIAEKVISLLGVPCGKLSGRHGVKDFDVIRVRHRDRTIHFVDAFSANDVDSTRMIQQRLVSEKYCPKPFVAILNNRSDRPLRTVSFLSFLSSEPFYDFIFLCGEMTHFSKRRLRREDKGDRVRILKGKLPEEVLEEICEKMVDSEFTLVGIGNYQGPGEKLSRFVSPRPLQ